MNSGLEDLIAQAKRTNSAGAGSATDFGFGVAYFDFSKNAGAGAVGQKRTGLYIPPNTMVDVGFLRADGATTGGFNVQLLAAGDVVAAQTALANGDVVNTSRVFNATQERELLINVSATATGKVLIWLRLLPC